MKKTSRWADSNKVCKSSKAFANNQQKVTELIKQYAVVNNCTQCEMLERIVLEWNTQQSESERSSGDEDE